MGPLGKQTQVESACRSLAALGNNTDGKEYRSQPGRRRSPVAALPPPTPQGAPELGMALLSCLNWVKRIRPLYSQYRPVIGYRSPPGEGHPDQDGSLQPRAMPRES